MACATIDESVSSLVVLDADGRGLELTFWIEADRCAHRLAAIAGTQRVVLLESMEGAAVEPWPSSPPWQQVNGSSVYGGASRANAILLVGAAGSSHWSASVERICVERTQKGASSVQRGQGLLPVTGLLFDVACRAKSRPKCLSSTYRIANPHQVVLEPPGSECLPLGLQTEIGRYELRGLPLGPTQPDSCQLGSSDNLVWLAMPIGTYQGPATFRWRYQIRLV